MAAHTYVLEIVQGHSPYDHLAPIINYDGIIKYKSLKDARKALREGILAQGPCAWMSSRARVDIIRSDGRRFEWEECAAGKGIKPK